MCLFEHNLVQVFKFMPTVEPSMSENPKMTNFDLGQIHCKAIQDATVPDSGTICPIFTRPSDRGNASKASYKARDFTKRISLIVPCSLN